MKKQLLNNICQKLAILICLPSILFLVSGCDISTPITSNIKHEKMGKNNEPSLNNASTKEIILFCGNPGVGKSTLCNSIVGKIIFESGVNIGGGMTKQEQGYVYDNKLYIDTPGLDDVKLKETAAIEIEKALKHNNNYKILFVVTVEAGRIRPADLVAINTVCDAIKTDFEYGLIFNKITKKVMRHVEQKGVDEFLITFHRKPSSIIFIQKNENIEDEDNKCFDIETTNTIQTFISKLNTNYIADIQVEPLDIRDYQEKVDEAEKKYKEQLAKHQSAVNKSEEQKQELQEETHRCNKILENNEKIFMQQMQQYKEQEQEYKNQAELLSLEQDKYIQEIERKAKELERVQESKLQLKKQYKQKIQEYEEQKAKNEADHCIKKAQIIQSNKEEIEKQEKDRNILKAQYKKQIKTQKKQIKELETIMQLNKEENARRKRELLEIERRMHALQQQQYQQQQYEQQQYQQQQYQQQYYHQGGYTELIEKGILWFGNKLFGN